MPQEQINQIIGALLVAVFKVLKEHLAEPPYNSWSVYISLESDFDHKHLVGRFSSEASATLALIRELDRVFEGEWEISASGQFVDKVSGGGDTTMGYILGGYR